jgi:hypothetical protein
MSGMLYRRLFSLTTLAWRVKTVAVIDNGDRVFGIQEHLV